MTQCAQGGKVGRVFIFGKKRRKVSSGKMLVSRGCCLVNYAWTVLAVTAESRVVCGGGEAGQRVAGRCPSNAVRGTPTNNLPLMSTRL